MTDSGDPTSTMANESTDSADLVRPILGFAEEQSPADRLVNWYGHRGESRIRVPMAIFETFEVEIPAELDQNDCVEIMG